MSDQLKPAEQQPYDAPAPLPPHVLNPPTARTPAVPQPPPTNRQQSRHPWAEADYGWNDTRQHPLIQQEAAEAARLEAEIAATRQLLAKRRHEMRIVLAAAVLFAAGSLLINWGDIGGVVWYSLFLPVIVAGGAVYRYDYVCRQLAKLTPQPASQPSPIDVETEKRLGVPFVILLVAMMVVVAFARLYRGSWWGLAGLVLILISASWYLVVRWQVQRKLRGKQREDDQ